MAHPALGLVAFPLLDEQANGRSEQRRAAAFDIPRWGDKLVRVGDHTAVLGYPADVIPSGDTLMDGTVSRVHTDDGVFSHGKYKGALRWRHVLGLCCAAGHPF